MESRRKPSGRGTVVQSWSRECISLLRHPLGAHFFACSRLLSLNHQLRFSVSEPPHPSS